MMREFLVGMAPVRSWLQGAVDATVQASPTAPSTPQDDVRTVWNETKATNWTGGTQ